MAEEKQQIELDLEDEQDTEVELEATKEEPQVEAFWRCIHRHHETVTIKPSPLNRLMVPLNRHH